MKTKHTLAFVVACLINHWNNTGTRPSPELLYSLAKPITFTRSNIETFLKDAFNHPWYGTYCLPANFMHISDLLSYHDRVKNPRDFSLSIFNLFHSRLKESQWVNPYALAQIIDVIIKQCEPLCAITKNTTRAAIKKTLYQAMLSRFHELKTDPEFFMTSVADEIITVVERGEQESAHELQNVITRFIESALDKLVWDPREQEGCWESCKLIAEQLRSLHHANIIRHEITLNHCYWSLVYRFCYFIETAGEHLSPATYTAIKHDIAEKKCALFSLEEQEELLLSKIKRLQNAILDGEVRALSIQKGIWIET